MSQSTASESRSTVPGSQPAVSEAKRAANARNGRLGGPKTPEGKARSCMNSLKHGLRAETLVVLPGEDAGAFARRLEAWSGELAPHGELERYYAETIVTASWRRDRCIRNETAVLTERVLDAAGPDPERAAARARRLGARLAEDPAAVAHKLRRTSAGCRWMLQRWDDLDETLDDLGFWEHSRLHLALNLLGFAAQQWRDEWQVTAVLTAFLAARRREQADADDVRHALGGRPAAMGKLEFENEVEAVAEFARGLGDGRARLKAIIAEARADLQDRLEWVEAVEARRRATAADRAAFDDSASGQRRQRYEAMHERTLRSALRDLRAAQALRMAGGDVATTPVGSGETGEGSGPGPDPIAPSEPTAEAGCLAPNEPTEDPIVAPNEPTEDAGAIAPNEPTEAGEIGGKDDEEQNSVKVEVPATVVDRAGEPGRSGAVEGEGCRRPATMAGVVAVRPLSPFTNGGDGPTSVGLGRGHDRFW
jgi:hypothetical protein